MSVIWVNVLFMGAMAAAAAVAAAVLTIWLDKIVENRQLSRELAEYEKEFGPDGA